MNTERALLIVDVQNDFCPGGALAVTDGDRIVPALNQYIAFFQKHNWPIFASRDWHPPKTKHFKNYGGLWPVHCVQNTEGAAFHPDLKLSPEVVIVSKGVDPKADGYSAFEAKDERNKKDLLTLLREKGVKELFVGGLATDYCVKASTLDALKNGFHVELLTDAIRGVNLKADDSQKALKEMKQAGVNLMSLDDLDHDA